MSGASLTGVATDLLNQAKLSSSAQDKLFQLEQIKEIIFHRDVSLFPVFLGDITDFVIDKTVTVRKFLAAFGGETLAKFPLHTPAILKMFNFLVRDENDSVVRAVSIEMNRHYGRIAMFIVGLDTRSSQSFFTKNDNQHSPKGLWDMLKSVEGAIIETLASNRAENVRIQAIRFLTSYLLFSLPLNSFSHDRERALKRSRTESVSGRLQSAFNSVSISLHHAFLNKDQIEGEAKSLLTKLTLWAIRGGPQGAPFTGQQLGELGIVLAGVAKERPKEYHSILPAVTFLISSLNEGGDSSLLQLSSDVRHSLLDAAEDLADSAGLSADQNDEKKLRDALKAIQVPSKQQSSGSGAGVALLNNLLQMNENFSSEEDEPLEENIGAAMVVDDVDDDDNDLRIKNRAIAALNAIKPSNGAAVGNMQIEGPQASDAARARGMADAQAVERNTRDTVLAEDAPVFPDPPTIGPQWVVATGAVSGDVAFKSTADSNAMSPDGFFNVSLRHLQNLLVNGLQASTKMTEKNRSTFQKMVIRLILSLSWGELGGIAADRAIGTNIVRSSVLSIFQNIRITESEMLCDPPVPLQVSLPRRPEESEYTNRMTGRAAVAAETAAVKRRIELLIKIANEIYSISQRNATKRDYLVEFTYGSVSSDDIETKSEGNLIAEANTSLEVDNADTEIEDVISDVDLTLYENFCLASFSRLFQRLQHRQKGSSDFLFNLPFIPDSILHVLKMLMYSGTLPDAALETTAHRRKRKRGSDVQQQDLGTRVSSMEVLSQICLIEPVDMSNHTTVVALSQLLWATTSADFKTRTSAINTVVSELVPNGAFLNDMVTLFALQSALVVTGSGVINRRCAELKEFENSEREELDKLIVSGSSADFASVNIEDASLQFDAGASFYGSFRESIDALSVLGIGDQEDETGAASKAVDTVDSIMRKHLHLLIQLCLLNPDTLESLFNLYGASAAIVANDPSASRHVMACRIIKAEFCNILASLTSSFPPEKVLDRVLLSDPLSRKLVILSLETLFLGSDHVASPEVVEKVRHYVGRQALHNKYKKRGRENSDSETRADANTLEMLLTTELLVPVISGLSASEVVEQVPSIIMLCLRYRGDLEEEMSSTQLNGQLKNDQSSDAPLTALYHAFSRIVRPRPPPLSKAGLLVALHRLSADENGLTEKEIQDAIGLCINKVSPQWDLDFKGSVVVEAASKLLSDESMAPPFQIMRTLLLACRIMPEVMKYMLSDAIPRLARRRAWESGPRVWDGVLHAMKKYYNAPSRDGVESLLRTILGLPMKQFKIVLKLSGGNIKSVLAAAVRTYSIAERTEVLSGSWIGLREHDTQDGRILKEKLDLIDLTDSAV